MPPRFRELRKSRSVLWVPVGILHRKRTLPEVGEVGLWVPHWDQLVCFAV